MNGLNTLKLSEKENKINLTQMCEVFFDKHKLNKPNASVLTFDCLEPETVFCLIKLTLLKNPFWVFSNGLFLFLDYNA